MQPFGIGRIPPFVRSYWSGKIPKQTRNISCQVRATIISYKGEFAKFAHGDSFLGQPGRLVFAPNFFLFSFLFFIF